MNEYVLVEFLAGIPNEEALLDKCIEEMGPDFVYLNKVYESEHDEDGNYADWVRVQGKISSQYASILKLQSPFLAERMRISYISEELKSKYRKSR